MLQCGLLRSNFSLAMGSYGRCFMWKVKTVGRLPGAGGGNRTRVFSLEGCCTTIVLHPRKSLLLAPRRGGGSRTRTYEGVRQGIYSPPPLPLGTFPQRARSYGL